MKLAKKCSTYLVICLVLLACVLQETEATRRVNRGRRTLTRRYFSGLAIPGWAMIVCIALAELLIGGALYFILKKVILDKEPDQGTSSYTPAPAAPSTYTPAPAHETATTVTPTPTHATAIA
ncbi:uncharacterized protein LOC110185252 [Drosophila serrata]|uniref:uncharacterized protein LOC110185252 n=1 Tax=Drosophila serrata TaxID=7274 RepID=UPI000A1D1C72|nr:uncharacterized protein LOC110185252 [Drosophila serrata]KAH8266055.1 hypothetical protein KR038_001520 [Drosophila bunnanda]KAH8376260.1 hypothetical protein KR200_003483 [Drosophila serrata]